MSAAWRPRFVIAAEAIDLTLETAMHPWSYAGTPIGSTAWSAAGVRATYEVLRPNDLVLHIRVLEHEHAAFEALLKAMHVPGRSTTFYPDAGGFVTTASYAVQLVHPQAGEPLAPLFLRSEQFIPLLDISITIRRTNNAQWALNWAPELGSSSGGITGDVLLLSTSDELDPAELLLLSGDMQAGTDALLLNGV